MTGRRITHALIVAALALGGCGGGDPGPGVVTTRRLVSDRGGRVEICVLPDEGQERCLMVPPRRWPGCDAGKRWPGCDAGKRWPACQG